MKKQSQIISKGFSDFKSAQTVLVETTPKPTESISLGEHSLTISYVLTKILFMAGR